MARVLRETPPEILQRIAPRPPAQDDWLAWIQLAQLLSRQHTELAADGLDFAAVAERGGSLPAFREQARWAALQQIQAAYLRQLDGLGLWDVQTARRVAVQRGEPATERTLYVIGAVDLTVTLRRMLDQVAERVTVLIAAPSEWADRFDPHGCLRPEVWQQVVLPIDEAHVHVADDPGDQADRVARCLAEYGGQYRPDEIAIGLGDEQLTPHIQRGLEACGLAVHSAAGVPLRRAGPCRLLEAAADFLQAERYPEFAALVRHPDLYDWIERARPDTGWLEQLDEYYSAHLPARAGRAWLGPRPAQTAVRKVCERVQRLLQPLGGGPRPLDQWGPPLRELLLAVYGHRSVEPRNAVRTDRAGRLRATGCRAGRARAADPRRLAAARHRRRSHPYHAGPAAVGDRGDAVGSGRDRTAGVAGIWRWTMRPH